MDRDISIWRGGVLSQEDPAELGLASNLFDASVAAFAALLRVLVGDLGRSEVDSGSYEVLRNEFQRFYMWNDGFSTNLGELDRILSCSKNLRATVLALMARWAKTVCRSNNAPLHIFPAALDIRVVLCPLKFQIC
jgi:hypothetical protein